jgi:protein required for attachment to host cells
MKRACIAVVDAARARLYTYEQDTEASANELREVIDLANGARRLRPYDLFADSGHGPGTPGHSFDDHRSAHVEDMDEKFAKDVVAEIDRIMREGAFEHVIVAASPNMLGDLRKCDSVLHRDGVIVDEIPSDLAKLTAPQLHDHLAQLKLLPPRQRPGARSAAR